MPVIKPHLCGVYAIRNKQNGKQYIGSSTNVRRRWADHYRILENNRHHSKHLQHAWNKYGKDAFEFIVLIETTDEQLVLTEQLFLDTFRPEYNICPVAKSCLGVKHGPLSEERKAKLRGRKRSEEQCRNIANSRLGKRHSPETLAKMSASKKGKGLDNETKEKISASLKGRIRKPFTATTRANQSKAHLRQWGDVPDGHKGCTACGKIKPVEAFGKNKNTFSGLCSYCKECRAIQAKTARTNRE